MELAKQIIREAREKDSFQERHLEGGDVVQFKVTDPQGFYRFLGEFGFDSTEDFERSTGLSMEDVINAGWFEFINNRIFPADPKTGTVKWDRALGEQHSNPKFYQVRLHPDENGEEIYKIDDQAGLEEFVLDAGFDDIETFEQETGLVPEDIYNAGWFAFTHNRVIPIDRLNK